MMSGRRQRWARQVLEATSPAKVTDATISTAYELEKTITITPGPAEFVIVTGVEAEIAMDKLAGLTTTITLGTKVVGLDGSPVDTATRTLSAASSATWCTDDSFALGSRAVTYRGGLGAAISVEFYLKSDQATSPTSYCIRNAAVDYVLNTRRLHGGALL